jgi:hypothetical protein
VKPTEVDRQKSTAHQFPEENWRKAVLTANVIAQAQTFPNSNYALVGYTNAENPHCLITLLSLILCS